MPDPTPATPETAHAELLKKIAHLRILTLISVIFSGLLVLIVILHIAMAIHHRHHKHHHEMHGDWGRREMMMHGGMPGGPGMMGGPGMGGMNGGPGMGHGPMPSAPHHPPMTPEESSAHMLDHLSKQLTLTDEEKAKIQPIVLAQAQEAQKEHEAFHAQMKQEEDAIKAKIRALLTPDQQKTFDTPPKPPGPGPEAGGMPPDAPKPPQ